MRGIFFALICAFFSTDVDAASPSVAGEQLSLIAASKTHDAKPMLVGLRMEMKDGWRTYWRVPGDSGIAPRFDWSGSENVAALDLLWPVPRRFDAEGDNTFGYEHEVVWPLLVRAADPEKPVVIKLVASYGICANICVPGEAHLTLTIPAAKVPAENGDGALIRRYLARVPVPPTDAGTVSARFVGDPAPHLNVRLVAAGEEPSLIVEGPEGVWFGTPKATRTGAAFVYSVPVELDPGKTLKDAEVTLTFSGPATAIEARRKLD